MLSKRAGAASRHHTRELCDRRRQPMDHNRHWVGTWATSPAPSEAGVGFNNHTLRMHPRVSIGGDTLRVRVSNAYGNGPLTIGAAYVGLRDKGPAIVPGSERQLTFGGSGSATVAAGALVISDSVTLDVQPLADLAVTLYLPGEIPPGFQITGRYARQTNYISPPGNFADAIDDAGRQDHRRMVLRQRHRRAGVARDRRRGRARRLADRRQYLDP